MKSPWVHALATMIAVMSWTWSTEAPAVVVTSGCANANQFCTVDELVRGASMVINDKLFDNWTADDASTVAPVDLSLLRVLPLDNPALNPGLAFVANGALITQGFDQIDLDLVFRVSVVGGAARIVGSTFELTAFDFGNSNMGGLVAITGDILAANGIQPLGDPEVFAILAVDSQLFDSITFPAEAGIVVKANILVTGEDPLDTVSLDGFTQRFVQRALPMPEPPSIATLGLALLAVWRTRRRSPPPWAERS